MRKSFRLFLALSLAIHIGMALWFLTRTDSDFPKPVPITISYQTAPSKTVSTPPARKTSPKTTSLRNLVPKYNLGKRNPNKKSPSANSLESLNVVEGKDSEEITAFTTPIQTLDDAVELDPFYQALWNRIAANTEYPEDFSKHYIQGSVTIRMEVDHQGMMTKKKLYVESTNPYLETLALYTLIKTLKQPLNPKHWSTKTRIPVTIHLNYIHRLPTDARDPSPGSIVGHHLEISKYDYIQPEFMKKMDDFMLTYFPPVIPITGGFYIDFVRAYEMIRRIQEPDENEMRSYRVEALEDAMERLITESQRSDDT